MFREDRQRINEINALDFKTIYKRLGIKTSIEDEKDLFSYLKINASKPNNMNLS